MTTRAVALCLTVAVAVEAVLLGALVHHDGFHHHVFVLVASAASVPVWAAAVWCVSRLTLRPRDAALLVLGVSAVLQIIALTHRPATSDDDYRYLWDAKVQLAGVDPYRHAPSSPALERLRDPSIFGAPDHCTHAFSGGCTSINRPGVRTVYPPAAEAAFDAVRVASFGGHGGHLPLQIAAMLGCLGVGLLILRRAGPWPAAVWSWCPVVTVEYANNAHIDWLAALLGTAALMTTRGTRVAGVLAGAAIVVKLYPALIVPSLMRRRWTVAVVAAVTVAVSYVPHVLAVGTKVLGYLPGYLKEEQYGSGGRLQLLGALLPHPADTAVGVVLVAVVAVWAWLRGPRDPARSAVVVVGVTLLAFTPSYGWYAGLLLALVALTGALEWLPVVLAPTYVYLDHAGGQAWIWTAALAATVAIATVRHREPLRAYVRRAAAR